MPNNEMIRKMILHTSNKGSMARYEPASWNASLNLGPAKIENIFTRFNPDLVNGYT